MATLAWLDGDAADHACLDSACSASASSDHGGQQRVPQDGGRAIDEG